MFGFTCSCLHCCIKKKKTCSVRHGPVGSDLRKPSCPSRRRQRSHCNKADLFFLSRDEPQRSYVNVRRSCLHCAAAKCKRHLTLVWLNWPATGCQWPPPQPAKTPFCSFALHVDHLHANIKQAIDVRRCMFPRVHHHAPQTNERKPPKRPVRN